MYMIRKVITIASGTEYSVGFHSPNSEWNELEYYSNIIDAMDAARALNDTIGYKDENF